MFPAEGTPSANDLGWGVLGLAYKERARGSRDEGREVRGGVHFSVYSE